MSTSVFASKPNVLDFRGTKAACYMGCFTMALVIAFPPVLFAVLHQQYGVSYTQLGALVLVSFCTQLGVDLVFTLFSQRFNVPLTLKIMPLLTSLGLLLYALLPALVPEYAYVGLLIGTVIFSASAGLSEVLLSPTVAALPSDTPQRDMSMLHSLYAFGVFVTAVVSTLFLKWFGSENWIWLSMLFALIPIVPAVLFFCSPIPQMQTGTSGDSGVRSRKRNIGLALCAACLFFGSCAENTMASWISSYMESALHIDKAVGDILGMAMFAVLLGIARICYGRWGKHILPVLLVGMAGSAVCYLAAAFSSHVMVAFLACVFTGLFAGMLWPGSLIMMEERVPGVGVAAFALMAASGDIGASFAPQLMGIVVDTVSARAEALGVLTGLSPEQLGLKAGMLVSAIFPIVGTGLLVVIIRYFGGWKSRPEPPKDNGCVG